MSKVLTVGTFDTPHQGHIKLFRKCRKIADLGTFIPYYPPYSTNAYPPREVIVALNRDKFVKRFKGKEPLYSYKERASVISAIGSITKVIENFSNDDLKPLLLSIKPDFLVVGSDWAAKDYYAQTKLSEEWLENIDCTLVYVSYTAGISTSILRERILGESH